MDAQDDLIALFADFAALGVRYLVVGGHAVAAHRRRHSTREVELWLDARRDNTLRACEALARFGVASELVESLRSAAPDEIIWLGEPPLRIQLQSLPAVDFVEAWPRRFILERSGVDVCILGKEDLIASKLEVGRPQDRLDAIALLVPPSLVGRSWRALPA